MLALWISLYHGIVSRKLILPPGRNAKLQKPSATYGLAILKRADLFGGAYFIRGHLSVSTDNYG